MYTKAKPPEVRKHDWGSEDSAKGSSKEAGGDDANAEIKGDRQAPQGAAKDKLGAMMAAAMTFRWLIEWPIML